MLVTMLLVGSWVSRRIEQATVQNFAIIAANYVESFIAPLTQDLAEGDALSVPAQQAMLEIFRDTALSERIVSYKIWKEGGLVVQASDTALIGQRFAPSEDLQAAWRGEFAASFEDLNDHEDAGEAALGVPLLEVYSPIHEVFSGRVIAVAEFYERAEPLQADLRDARRTGWLVVGSAFVASGILLFGIVQAGGRTIRTQQKELKAQLTASEELAEQNAALRRRAISANLRATAQTEQAIRRVGSDLHDGPAQYLSLAALRLESALARDAKPGARDEIRNSLERAMEEIRSISRGLALPDLESLDLPTLVRRAVSDHEKQTGMQVQLSFTGSEPAALGYTEKLCIYRFLQEGLSNATRHGKVDRADIVIDGAANDVRVTIHDAGAGFDPAQEPQLRTDGGQGLRGLKDRAESIGGAVTIDSAPGRGTTLTLVLTSEGQA
ncbi:ATP-binding protein [Marimonas arenosa]|uniref:histidine kinase n=1 Tax=Marimonas arenosa TaxID=1795305 RepID=A0AAE3W8L7_9RHOB|nr:ATP-binding protein [Marimonas arenosa]MDQ2088636.1 histidine kinase [Marimonas arenosa]